MTIIRTLTSSIYCFNSSFSFPFLSFISHGLLSQLFGDSWLSCHVSLGMLLSQDTRALLIENLLFSCSQWVPGTLSCFSDLSHPSSIHCLPCGPCQCCLGVIPVWRERAHCLSMQFSILITASVFPAGAPSEAPLPHQFSWYICFSVHFIHSSFYLLGIKKVASNRLIALTDFCTVIDLT